MDLPDAVEAGMLCLLAKDPADRPDSAAGLAETLTQLLSSDD